MTDDEGAFLDLYHRTSPEAAAAILRDGAMRSRESTQDVFFSTERDSTHAAGYGEAVVHVRVPASWAQAGLAVLDDEFELDDRDPSGEPRWEEHYTINAALLRPEHFVH